MVRNQWNLGSDTGFCFRFYQPLAQVNTCVKPLTKWPKNAIVLRPIWDVFCFMDYPIFRKIQAVFRKHANKRHLVIALASIFVFGSIQVKAHAAPISVPRGETLSSNLVQPLAVPAGVISVDYVTVTAYASVPSQTKSYGSPFITADMTHVYSGEIAANFLPFGTRVRIPALFGNKVFTVHDRMNSRYSDRVDIWMDSPAQDIQFGIHRNIQIEILTG